MWFDMITASCPLLRLPSEGEIVGTLYENAERISH